MITKVAILIKIIPGYAKTVFNTLKKVTKIKAAAITTGPYDIIVFVSNKDWSIIFKAVKDIRKIKGVKATITLPMHHTNGFPPKSFFGIVLTRADAQAIDVDELSEILYKRKHINFSASIAGPYDVILTIETSEIDIILEQIHTIKGISDTLTLTTEPQYTFFT
jgi:nitrate reductase NapAB chaperone NapD